MKNSKRNIRKWIIMVCLLVPFAATAQTDSIAKEPEVFRKNSVKINLSSLALNNYNFNYERSLSRKVSFVAGYRTMPSSVIGELPLTDKIFTKVDNEKLRNDLNKISASNQTYTGEFRFYGGKHAGARGFYLSLYGRYAKFDVDYDYDYTSNSNQSYKVPLKSTLTGYGGGLMFGAQWLIAKRVTFDWYIIGAHYGKLIGDGAGKVDLSSLTDSEKQHLKVNLESIVTVKDKKYLDATVNNAGITTKTDAPFVGVRGLGFSVGIAF